METYILHFLMAAVLFGFCLLLNFIAGDFSVKLPSYLGLFLSIGIMFYLLFNEII
jgi:hypothetical protein